MACQQFRGGWLKQMLLKQTQGKAGTHHELWRVFIGFDDLNARQRALEVCESITQQFSPEIEFDLDDCNFHELNEIGHLERAVASAATAKILIVSTSAGKGIEAGLHRWMAGLETRRHGREGVLVRLVASAPPEPIEESPDLGLRHLAHKLGLDYLTHAPDCRALQAGTQMETVEVRFKNLGPVLEEILAHSTRPASPI